MNTTRRHLEFRPLDFIYDPIFITSDKVDYYACAATGLKSVSQYAVQPQYGSMFTDNPVYPRNIVVFRSTILPHHVNVSWAAKKAQMVKDRKLRPHREGSNACQYFTRPNVRNLNPFANIVHITSPNKEEYDEEDIEDVKSPTKTAPQARTRTAKKVPKSVQTVYRESEAQTYPWAPKPPRDLNLPSEIVTGLDFSKWEEGFPMTQNDLDIIERTRLRRVYEKALNSTDMKLNNKKNLIKQIEIYEWSEREEDIQQIYKLREKLSRKQAHTFAYLNHMRMEERMQKMINRKKKETEKKIDKINRNRDRELRKLAGRQRSISITDICDVYNNYTSELYIQDPTKGANPKYKSQTKRKPRFQKSKELVVVGSDDALLESRYIEAKIKPKSKSVCPQEKKWKVKDLVDNYAKLKQWRALSSAQKMEDTLGEEVEGDFEVEGSNEKMEYAQQTSLEIQDDLDPKDDERYLNAVLLQKLIRGRKWQYMVKDGMKKTSILIDEMKKTISLAVNDVDEVEDRKRELFEKKRKEQDEKEEELSLDDIQGQLQGETISAVLDFLSKELIRLQDERRAHAYSLLAERQREMREAIESGKRQRGLERRKEFDEMFKQVVKIKQDTVDSYLESVLLDSFKCLSQDQARAFIVEKAKAIDFEAQEAFLKGDKMEEEEIVADLLYNFAIPELGNIRMNSLEEEKQRRGQKDVADLVPAMTTQPQDKPRETTEEQQEKDKKQRMDLHNQIMDLMFPLRKALTEEVSGVSSEVMSCPDMEEMENEMDQFRKEIQSLSEDLGLDMFEELLNIAHQTYEKVINQIIEEIIRTLLAKRRAHVETATPLNQSDFNMEMLDTSSFNEDYEDDHKQIESDFKSQESSEDHQEQ